MRHLDYIDMMGPPALSKEEGEKVVKSIRNMLASKPGRAAIAIELMRACDEQDEIFDPDRKDQADFLGHIDNIALSYIKPESEDLVIRIIKHREGKRGFVSFKELPHAEEDEAGQDQARD